MLSKIDVNNAVITAGKQRDGHSCPISHAIKPHLASNYQCYISETQILIYNPRKTRIIEQNNIFFVEKSKNVAVIQLPNVARSKVRHFDKTRNILPFWFDLYIPEKFLKKG